MQLPTISREGLVKIVNYTLEAEQREVAQWATELATNPAHAFEWGDGVLCNAARVETLQWLQNMIGVDPDAIVPAEQWANTLEHVVYTLAHKAWHATMYPASSTSAMSNLMAMRRAQAATWVIERVLRVDIAELLNVSK